MSDSQERAFNPVGHAEVILAQAGDVIGGILGRRIELAEWWGQLPKLVKWSMRTIATAVLENEQKHQVVVETAILAWRALTDWNIPWVPDALEFTVKGWLSPIVEAWIRANVDEMIHELFDTDPEQFV